MEDITQNPALNEFLQKYDKQDWNEVILKLCLISLGYLNANNPKPLYSFDELDEVLLNFQNQNNQIPSPNEITPPNQMGNSRINMPSQMVNNQNIPSQNENEQPYNISFQRNNQNPLGESNNSNINMRGINNSDINTSTPNNNKVLNPFDNIDNSNINNNIKNYNMNTNINNINNSNINNSSYYNNLNKNNFDYNPKFQSIDCLSTSNKYTYQNCIPDPCCDPCYNPYCDPCHPCYDPCCCICKPSYCPPSNYKSSFSSNLNNNFSSSMRNNYQSSYNFNTSGLGNSNYSIRKPCSDCN